MLDSESRLRALIIATLFIIGIILVFYGWSITGKMVGLLLMLFGVSLLLAAVFVYNKPYK